MQALRTVALLAALMPASCLLARTPSSDASCGIGEEKARGRGRLWRGRAVDAEDEEEGASAASYAVDAPLTRRWPRRTSRRRRTTSPASLDRGTRTTQTRTRLGAQKRGGKIGKRGDGGGPAAQPSGA